MKNQYLAKSSKIKTCSKIKSFNFQKLSRLSIPYISRHLRKHLILFFNENIKLALISIFLVLNNTVSITIFWSITFLTQDKNILYKTFKFWNKITWLCLIDSKIFRFLLSMGRQSRQNNCLLLYRQWKQHIRHKTDLNPSDLFLHKSYSYELKFHIKSFFIERKISKDTY